MALTELQREILRALAATRRAMESHVAGVVALNTLLLADRRSSDIDLFHDVAEAVARTADADRRLLLESGFGVQTLREVPQFVEAMISRGESSTLIQWIFDSAYRFFPLIDDDTLGLTFHPIDPAINKALAMASRLEARDFVDMMTCCEQVQPLGFLVWAAPGKDPGWGPPALLQAIKRASRYSQDEIDILDFGGHPPNARELALRWRDQCERAETI